MNANDVKGIMDPKDTALEMTLADIKLKMANLESIKPGRELTTEQIVHWHIYDGWKNHLEILQLTEKKRRLLSEIIELSRLVVSHSFKNYEQCTAKHINELMKPFFPLLEFKKRIDIVLTIEELASIKQELQAFKLQHPELTAT